MTIYGFLFDVDGCITPKDSTRTHPIPDPTLFPWFKKIKKLGHKLAFITGRAYPFMKHTAPELLKSNYIFFFENNWCSYIDQELKVDPKARQWRKLVLPQLFQILKKKCNQRNIPFSTQEHVLPPDNGALWIEKKYAMLSIVVNTQVSVEAIHTCMEDAIPTIFDDSIKKQWNKLEEDHKSNSELFPRITHHHLGTDLMLPETSKEHAAQQAKEILDPNSVVNKWFIFGDNEYDQEMCLPFDSEKVKFINTREHASSTVLSILKALLNS